MILVDLVSLLRDFIELFLVSFHVLYSLTHEGLELLQSLSALHLLRPIHFCWINLVNSLIFLINLLRGFLKKGLELFLQGILVILYKGSKLERLYKEFVLAEQPDEVVKMLHASLNERFLQVAKCSLWRQRWYVEPWPSCNKHLSKQ